MELYILRHAIAEAAPNPPSGGDSRRRLTAEGAEKMRRAAEGMKALELSFDLIISSPFLRAKETAQIVADVLASGKRIEFSAKLEPEGNLREFVEELGRKHGEKKSVLVVGHEPSLSRLISVLASGEAKTEIDFKKGALCKLTAETLAYGHCAALEWLLTSRQLRRMA
jgi:phosphohistidine phosphatase